MNGLEKITARIEQDARAEIAEQMNAANAEVEKLRQAAEEKAAERLRLGRAEIKAAAASHAERKLAAFEMETRQETLKLKQEFIDKAFAMAEDKLVNADEETLLARLSDFIVSVAETGREEVLLSKENRARFGEKLLACANEKKPGAAFVLAEETRETDGVVLRSGKIEYNGSLSTRLQELRQKLAYEVAETLFGA